MLLLCITSIPPVSYPRLASFSSWNVFYDVCARLAKAREAARMLPEYVCAPVFVPCNPRLEREQHDVRREITMKVKKTSHHSKSVLAPPLYAALSQNMSTVFIFSNHLKPAWC